MRPDHAIEWRMKELPSFWQVTELASSRPPRPYVAGQLHALGWTRGGPANPPVAVSVQGDGHHFPEGERLGWAYLAVVSL